MDFRKLLFDEDGAKKDDEEDWLSSLIGGLSKEVSGVGIAAVAGGEDDSSESQAPGESRLLFVVVVKLSLLLLALAVS